MTILNFVLQEDFIGVVTDSVVSEPGTMDPALFTTKVYPLPHLKGAICGTGLMHVIAEWAIHAATSILARDIHHLDEFTPAILREIFQDFQSNGSQGGATTIYHFGFSEEEARFIGFAYRSTNNFVSERLRYGLGLKPVPDDTNGVALEIKSFPEHLIPISVEQKKQDDEKPVSERVGIGGELFAYTLVRNQSGTVDFGTTHCHTFPDFEDAYQRAAEKLPMDQSTP